MGYIRGKKCYYFYNKKNLTEIIQMDRCAITVKRLVIIQSGYYIQRLIEKDRTYSGYKLYKRLKKELITNSQYGITIMIRVGNACQLNIIIIYKTIRASFIFK